MPDGFAFTFLNLCARCIITYKYVDVFDAFPP